MAWNSNINDNGDFGNAFQRQFKRGIGIGGGPDLNGPTGGFDPVGPGGGLGSPQDIPVGGGGGPMPVPDGGPHWRQGNPVGDLPTGGGGGPMPVPDGGPNWRNDPNFNDEGSAAHAWGMRGGMPIPDGGPNWRTQGPVGDQPTGGGGGPMPVPPPWIRFGGKPEDYGVTMEYGGPGAINPVGMGPQDLRNLYNPPPPPPPVPNPQMATPPAWVNNPRPVGGGFGVGILDSAGFNPMEPKRHGPGGNTALPPKRHGVGGGTPPPPMAQPGMPNDGSAYLGGPRGSAGDGWKWGDPRNLMRRFRRF